MTSSAPSRRQAIVTRAQAALRDLQCTVHDEGKITRFRFPKLPTSEYHFEATVSEDDVQVEAVLSGQRDRPSKESYFWYWPEDLLNEPADGQTVTAGLAMIRQLLTHETRIRQSRGWFFWNFRCEYREGDRWKHLSTTGSLRGGIPVPAITGKQRLYVASAVIPSRLVKSGGT